MCSREFGNGEGILGDGRREGHGEGVRQASTVSGATNTNPCSSLRDLLLATTLLHYYRWA